MCPDLRLCQNNEQKAEPGLADRACADRACTAEEIGPSNTIKGESEAIAQRVSQKIDEVFALGARLSAHRISISVRNNIVALSGFVRNSAEREEAEAAARAVPNVADVINRIQVP